MNAEILILATPEHIIITLPVAFTLLLGITAFGQLRLAGYACLKYSHETGAASPWPRQAARAAAENGTCVSQTRVPSHKCGLIPQFGVKKVFILDKPLQSGCRGLRGIAFSGCMACLSEYSVNGFCWWLRLGSSGKSRDCRLLFFSGVRQEGMKLHVLSNSVCFLTRILSPSLNLPSSSWWLQLSYLIKILFLPAT